MIILSKQINNLLNIITLLEKRIKESNELITKVRQLIFSPFEKLYENEKDTQLIKLIESYKTRIDNNDSIEEFIRCNNTIEFIQSVLCNS